MVTRGEFRKDLFYRLNLIPIHIPPLRERKEDISLLTRHFLKRFNSKYGKNKQITNEALQCMMEYNWPGNIRELENLLERLVIIGNEVRITSTRLNSLLYMKDISMESDSGQLLSLKDMMTRYERDILQSALERYGTTYEAAKALGTSQPTVARKAKQYGLEW